MSSPMEKKWKDKSRNKNKENDGELCKRAHSQIQPVREAGIQTAAQAYLQTTRPSHSKATALPSFASRRCAWLNSDLMTLTVRAARSRGPQQTWHRASQGPQPRDRQTRPETLPWETKFCSRRSCRTFPQLSPGVGKLPRPCFGPGVAT